MDDATTNGKKKARGYQPGQPRFHCQYPDCDASFARQEHLKRHTIGHDKSVTFVCKFCQRSFARKDIMTRHIRRQHENPTPKRRRTSSVIIQKVPGDDDDNALSVISKEEPFVQSQPLNAIVSGAEATTTAAGVVGGVIEDAGVSILAPIFDYQIKQPRTNGNPINEESPGNSPDAILGNSSQAVSQLLNDDFMNWLFSQAPIDGSYIDNNAEMHFFQDPQQPEITSKSVTSAPANLVASPASSSSLPPLESFPCNQETCDLVRVAMDLTAPSPLVEKYINPGFLTYAVDLYWSLHIRWPILHRPSFSINECPPLLLVSIITISMYLTRDEDAIKLAVILHDNLRYKVYSLPEFRESSALWVFQTLLLAEIFEKMCSNEEQHDLATRFHDVLIASMRRGSAKLNADSWSSHHSGSIPTLKDPEWQRFIDSEARKRVAFFAFVVDTQHTALFNHPPSMFISDMRFRLPCDEALWEAADAEQWHSIKNKYPPPPYFTTTIGQFLKLHPHTTQSLSPWSMMVILHGLISVGWHMRLRESIVPDHHDKMNGLNGNGNSGGGTSSGSMTPQHQNQNQHHQNHHQIEHVSSQRWAKTICESYFGWLRHYRLSFIVNGKLPYNHPYLLGCLTTYEFAHVILTTDIQQLLDFTNLLSKLRQGLLLGGSQQSFLLTLFDRLSRWASSPDAAHSLRHALDLIDMFLLGDNAYDVTRETAFHRTWCLYVASTLVWVFHFLCGSPDGSSPAMTNGGSGNDLREYLAHIRALVATPSLRARARSTAPGVLLQPHAIISCEARILLAQVVNVLQPCPWGVMRRQLAVARGLLGGGEG